MRRLMVLILPLLVLAAAGAPACAGDPAAADSGQGIDLGEKFTLTGSLRARWERLDNYFDFDDQTDDAFSFFPYRARLGVLATLTDNVQVLLEIQNFGSWGNQSPNQSFFFPRSRITTATGTPRGPGPRRPRSTRGSSS